jgi:hypothetical protein
VFVCENYFAANVSGSAKGYTSERNISIILVVIRHRRLQQILLLHIHSHTPTQTHHTELNVTEIFHKTFFTTDPQVLNHLFLQLVKPEIALNANFASINQSNQTIKLINE